MAPNPKALNVGWHAAAQAAEFFKVFKGECLPEHWRVVGVSHGLPVLSLVIRVRRLTGLTIDL